MSKFDYPEAVEARHLEIVSIVGKMSLDRLRELAEADAEGCEYRCEDTDSGTWGCSKCDTLWMLNDGNPFDNEMNYCSGCGRPIKSIRYKEWRYESDEDCGEIEIVMTRAEYVAAALAEKGK